MYFNNAQCDIYIGTGAGKKLMEEMAAARSSVKIVSPFLSGTLLSGLVALHDKGIRVELITTEGERPQDQAKLNALVQQHVHVDAHAKTWRIRIRFLLRLSYILTGLLLVASWFFFTGQQLRFLLYVLIVLGLLLVAIGVLHHVHKGVQVYSYSYSSLFPLKVIKNLDDLGQRVTYLHSKIYIIDDRIAYLGSLNFTDSGTRNNYETRIRLTDQASVQKIGEEFRYLMDRAEFPEADMGASLQAHFSEPLY